MEQGYRILSGYNEDVEYTFDSMNLELEDEMTESDVYTIELFGKPYLIAMGKLNSSDDNETLGYFICYLLYQDKVVRKLGIYEINISANEMETINHRTFDFQKEKLLLFDEYYEDVNKLRPYLYNKEEEEVSKQTMIKLKQSNIEFEENKEKYQQFISELQIDPVIRNMEVEEIEKIIMKNEKEMSDAAEKLDFYLAAKLRDENIE